MGALADLLKTEGVTARSGASSQPQGMGALKQLVRDSGGYGDAVSTAKSYLGTPYKWGGTSRTGIDCSGLTQCVYKNLPRTAAEQWKKTSRTNEPQPGDLVFLKDTGGRKGITHVGIYAGDGKFIHAAAGGSRKVIEDRLDTPYNKSHFAGYGRTGAQAAPAPAQAQKPVNASALWEPDKGIGQAVASNVGGYVSEPARTVMPRASTADPQMNTAKYATNVAKSVGEVALGAVEFPVKQLATAMNALIDPRVFTRQGEVLKEREQFIEHVASKTGKFAPAVRRLLSAGKPMTGEELQRMPQDMVVGIYEGFATAPEQLKTGEIAPLLNSVLMTLGAAHGIKGLAKGKPTPAPRGTLQDIMPVVEEPGHMKPYIGFKMRPKPADAPAPAVHPEIARAKAEYLRPDNPTPGAALRKLREMLPREKVDQIRDQRFTPTFAPAPAAGALEAAAKARAKAQREARRASGQTAKGVAVPSEVELANQRTGTTLEQRRMIDRRTNGDLSYKRSLELLNKYDDLTEQVRSGKLSGDEAARQYDEFANGDHMTVWSDEFGDGRVYPSVALRATPTATPTPVEATPGRAVAPMPAKTAVSEAKTGTVVRMKTKDIGVDPHRFQFRMERNPELENVKKWDVDLAGVSLVWEDPATGKTWVVNGHHRLNLANRLKVDEVDVRYINAETAAEARVKGALVNIAEGRASAVDAAKLFRDSGITADDLTSGGVSLTGKVASDGMALSKLNDNLFNAVIQGKLTQDRAAAIGRRVSDSAAQDALYALIQKKAKTGKPLSAIELDELTRRVLAAPDVVTKQVDLFGASELKKNLAVEEAQLSGYIREQLRRDKTLFGRLSKEAVAKELERGRNIIEPGENARIAAESAIIDEVYSKLSGKAGSVSDILHAGAERIAAKENINVVKAEVYRQIREEVSAVVEGRESGRLRPAQVDGRTEPTPTSQTSEVTPTTPAKPAPAPAKPQFEPTPAGKQAVMEGMSLADTFELTNEKAPSSPFKPKPTAKQAGQTGMFDTTTPAKATAADAFAKAQEAKQAGKLGEASKALDDVADAALKRISERNKGRATAGVDPFNLADITIYTAAKIAKGAVDSASLAAHLAEKFGPEVARRAKQVWDDAVTYLKNAGHDVSGFKWAVKDAELGTEVAGRSGINKAQMAAVRKRLGLRPLDKPPFKGKAESYGEGKTAVDNGTIDAYELAKDLIDNPRVPTSVEAGAMRYHLDQIKDALQTAKGEAREELLDRLDTITRGARRGGTEWSAAGHAYQTASTATDLGNIGDVLQLARDNKARKLTRPEVEEITRLQKEYSDYKARTEARIAALEAKKQGVGKPQPRAVKTPSDFARPSWGGSNKVVTIEAREANLARLRELSSRMHSGIDPEYVAVLAKEIAFHAEAGVRFSYKVMHDYLAELGAPESAIKAAWTRAKNDTRLDASKRRLMGRIEDLEAGKLPARPPAVKWDKEIVDLRVKQEAAKSKLLKKIEPPMSMRNIRQRIAAISGAPLGWLASWDNSYLGRQGRRMMSENPKAWYEGAKQSHRAMASEGTALLIDDAIQSHRHFATARQAGLEYTSLSPDAPLATAEEQSMYIRSLGKAGKVLRPFDRAYTTAGNVMRHQAFYDYVEAAGEKLTPEMAREYAKFLNTITGRGNLGRLGAFQAELNMVFTSARNFFADWELPRYLASKEPMVRKRAALLAVKEAVALGSLAYIVNATGKATIEVDPRSKDFGNMRVGDTRFNLLGSARTAVRTAMATGEALYDYSRFAKQKPTPLTPSATDVVTRYLNNKIHPTPSFLKSLWTGKDWAGQPVTLKQSFADFVTPWNAQEVWEAWKQAGPGMGAAVGAAAFYGFGANTYEDSAITTFEADKDTQKKLKAMGVKVGYVQNRFEQGDTVKQLPRDEAEVFQRETYEAIAKVVREWKPSSQLTAKGNKLAFENQIKAARATVRTKYKRKLFPPKQ